MSQVGPRSGICLLQQTTLTTTGTGSVIVLPAGYLGAIITLNVATVSGTSPTLDMYLQNVLRGVASTDVTGSDVAASATAVNDDYLHFTQVTSSTSVIVARCWSGSSVCAANKNKTLAAATVAAGPIGGSWQLAWTIAGTSPSFSAVSVVAELIPPA